MQSTYFPLLRMKPAECKALAGMFAVRDSIKPIVELVPAALKTALESGVNEFAFFEESGLDLFRFWGNPVYVDIQHIAGAFRPAGNHPFAALIDRCAIVGQPVTPIINLSSYLANPNYLSVVKGNRNLQRDGVGLRITHAELTAKDFTNILGASLANLNLPLNLVDLVVDYKGAELKPNTIAVAINRIPKLSQWNRLIFLAGSFPEDLSQFSKAGEYQLERKEWNAWKALGTANLQRIPGFGDYTIQHAYFSEKLDAFSPSPSVRYTSYQNWLIFRGKKKFGHEQYPAHAQLLCARPEFMGEHYSPGDKYIFEKSKELSRIGGKPRTGNSTEWLTASINHHVHLTSWQVKQELESLRKSAVSGQILP